MVDLEFIRGIAEEKTKGTDLFVVELKVAPGNEIELLIDSDTSVGIDSCVELSKVIQTELGDDEDYELTVASAGIGQPLKLLRQYRKFIGRPVEVLLKNGTKIVAVLVDVDETKLRLRYEEKVAAEGKKRKETVEVEREYAMDEIKHTREFLDFK